MEQIIKRFVDGDSGHGLLLLDLPTGFGKTYSVVEYMFQEIMKEHACSDRNGRPKRKFIFLTTLKKNLPEQDLKKKFKEAGMLREFEEEIFLRIDSNSESVLAGFTPKLEKQIPVFIKSEKAYRSLKSDIDLIARYRSAKPESAFAADHNMLLKTAEENFRNSSEPAFRQMLLRVLKKKCPKKSERKDLVMNDSDWNWVLKLYPSILIEEKQILFMSMDKFLLPIFTLYRNSIQLVFSDLLKNAVVFIDEFDATKETVLRNIIENRKDINLLELLMSIHAACNKPFPADLTRPSLRRLENKSYTTELTDILDSITQKINQFYSDYNLQYVFKTDTVLDPKTTNFIFQDHRWHSVLNDRKKWLYAEINLDDHVNLIKPSDGQDEKKSNTIKLYEMMNRARGFLNYALTGALVLADNYKQKTVEQGRDTLTREEAISTTLWILGVGDQSTINYLGWQIQLYPDFLKASRFLSKWDMSYYQKGFRYFDLVDDYRHDLQTSIMMADFSVTPEKIMLQLCSQAKVIGISATCTLDSKTGNYDIAYLKEKLKSAFCELTDSEKQSLKNRFENANAGYDKIQIHTQLVGLDKEEKDALKNKEDHWKMWLKVVSDEELARYLYQIIELSLPPLNKEDNEGEDTYDYIFEGYLRICSAFKTFIEEDSIHSFLCILTLFPRNSHYKLDLKTLNDLFSLIASFCGKADQFSFEKQVMVLKGDGYEETRNAITKKLSEGEKIFVFSTYQTLGAGQNLQYPIPKQLKKQFVRINKYPRRGETDFDSIYLDRPTNLIPVLSQSQKWEAIRNGKPMEWKNAVLKYMFFIMMLQENGEISQSQALGYIRTAFIKMKTNEEEETAEEKLINENYYVYYKRLLQTPSLRLMATRTIIQAVGRICRTNMKSKDIWILADLSMSEYLDFGSCRDILLNKETEQLMRLFQPSGPVPADNRQKQKLALAALVQDRSWQIIQDFLHFKWTKSTCTEWQKLRSIVLKWPTISEEQMNQPDFAAQDFYIHLPAAGNSLYFRQTDDYKKTEISFEPKEGFSAVSAEKSKLKALMKHPYLKQYFEENNFAVDFAENEYILTPVIFNNIYKGALGEAAGKALLEKFLNIQLDEIEDPEIFEKFDYRISGTSVFVDFKNWHLQMHKDSEQEFKHIAKKARECESSCVLIINLLSGPEYKIRQQTIDGVQIIVIPSVLQQTADQVAVIPSVFQRINEVIYESNNQNKSA